MALRWVDNFEFWTTTPGTFTSQTGCSVNTSRWLASSGAAYGQITLDSQGTWIINMRVAISVAGSGGGILTFVDGSTTQCTLAVKSSGKLAFYQGAFGGTQRGSDSTTALTLSSAVYYDIEVKVVLGNSGSVTVKVNGATEITASSVDLTQTGNDSADVIRVGTDGSQPTVYYKQVVVMDSTGAEMNDYIGPVSVNLHDTTADGNYTTWAANTGNRYQAVDEANPDSDTTYVSAASVGDKVTFAMANLPAGVTTVHALAVWSNAKRDDAATRGYKTLLRASATDSNPNAEHSVGSSYAYFFDAFADSPFTSSPWGTSEVDGLEVGAIITT